MARFFRLAFSGLAALGAVLPVPAYAAIQLRAGMPADTFNATNVTADQDFVTEEDLSEPTDLAELPDGRLVIVYRLGKVVVVSAAGEMSLAGTITVNPDFGEQGLLGVVADPGFATNNTLYFFASVGNDYANKNKVYKIPLGTDGMLAASRDTVIAMGLRSSAGESGGFGNHNGGGLVVHDGKLFVSVGDTGHNATPPTNHLGTCLNKPSGKILRVNLDGTVPSDNPLVGEAMVTGCDAWNGALNMAAPDTRVFNWGFRNPFRFWIDPMTTRMWVGDVGETTREEIAVGAPLTAAGGDGQHFGWPFAEGTQEYDNGEIPWAPAQRCMGVTPARECVPAVFDYAHSNGNNCVIGGLIPSGCGWDAPWTSKYFFGDNGSGIIWTLDVNQDRSGVVANSRAEFASSSGIAAFRMGASGALYFVEARGNRVTKITPKAQMPGMCAGMGGMGGMGGMAGSGTSGMGMGGSSDGGTGMGTSGGGSGGSASGAGGAGGSAGATTGGAGAGGGAGGATGGTTGGTSGGTTGGTAGGATGGTTGGTTGGSGGAGGAPRAGAAGTGGGGEPSGCGCRVAGGGSNLGAVLAGLGGLALLGLRRSRQRRGKLG
jgi:glucose/arabinose dehydrogenase